MENTSENPYEMLGMYRTFEKLSRIELASKLGLGITPDYIKQLEDEEITKIENKKIETKILQYISNSEKKTNKIFSKAV